MSLIFKSKGKSQNAKRFDLNGHFTFLIFHSVRKDFTGLATAALTAWKLIVAKAMTTENKPAMINIPALMWIRYAKSLSQVFITYQATGEATANAIKTNLIKFLESRNTMFETDAPTTFLTPISLTRCCTV